MHVGIPAIEYALAERRLTLAELERAGLLESSAAAGKEFALIGRTKEGRTMRVASVLLVVLLTISLAGCEPVLSLHPWLRDEDVIDEPALEGTWVNLDADLGMLVFVFERSGKGSFTLRVGEIEYDARLGRIGGHLFLDVTPSWSFLERSLKEKDSEFYLPLIPAHFLLPIELEDDRFKFAYLDDDYVEREIKEGRIKVAAAYNGELGLASTEELQAVIKHSQEQMRKDLQEAEYYYRQPPEVGDFEIGKYHVQKGRFDAGIARFELALKRRPEYADAYYGLGMAYSGKRLFDKSISFFNRAIRLEAGRPDYRFERGLAFLAQGRPDLARNDFQETLRLQPDHDKAQFQLAFADFLQERYELAAEEFEKYLASRERPEVSHVRWYVLTLLHLGRKAEAERFAKKYLETCETCFVLGEKTKIRYLVGAATEEELLRSEDSEWSARFSVAYRELLEGQRSKAHLLFCELLSQWEADPELRRMNLEMYLVVRARLGR